MTDVDVAIVGAGIAGLATAYRLGRAGRSVQVFEAGDAVGGRMRSRRYDGYLIDEGAETLAVHGYPSTWELIGDLGIGPAEILPVTSSVAVWRDCRAHPRVGHPLGGVTGAGLSARGRLELGRMAGSFLMSARRYDGDRPESTPLGRMTVAEFARRRRPEIRDYLLQPAAGTAFGWRPERSCMGPLVATLLATRGIFRWRTYRDGMDTLARRVAARVPVQTGRIVTEVKNGQGRVLLGFADGGLVSARSAVLAVPAPVALDLYPSMPDDERPYVSACTYAPLIRVICALDRALEPARGRRSPRVYALLVPEREDGVLGGLTIEHNKAANRAPRGRGLVSLLSAPRVTEDLIDCSDDEIVATLLRRAENYLPGVRAAVQTAFVRRFHCGAPEATPAALALRRGFVARPARSVEYAGDWVYQRPISEAAVRSSALAATRILSLDGRS